MVRRYRVVRRRRLLERHEAVIRQRTAKLIFLLSRVSNKRDGCIRELRIANAVKNAERSRDFIIPVRVDDIPHAAMNIELTGLKHYRRFW